MLHRRQSSADHRPLIVGQLSAGEMLAGMEMASGSRGVGKKVGSQDATPLMLDDLGINKSQSSRWQKSATVSDSNAHGRFKLLLQIEDSIADLSHLLDQFVSLRLGGIVGPLSFGRLLVLLLTLPEKLVLLA